MDKLLREIEAQIAGAKAATAKQNVGVIREIGDGVAKIEGLADAMLNEMIDLGHGATGLALNLDETEVGVIILGDYTKLQEGDEVRATGKLLQVPVGKGLLGRVVNTLGEPLDGKGPVKSDAAYPVEKTAPGIIKRQSVSQPVQTGIMAIDAMIPIGRGQRELIIGDRSTGKTTICIDTIINQARLNKAAEDGGRQGPSPALLHLRRDRPEAVEHRADHLHPRAGGGDALHDRPRLRGFRLGGQPVPGSLRGSGHGRVVHGQRHGRPDHLRRPVQARGGLPAGLPGAEAAVGPRGLPRRRVLPPQPSARAGGAGRGAVRQRVADGPAHHRDAGRRRLRVHPHERHLDHGRADLPGDGPLLPGRSPRDLGRPLGVAGGLGGPAQGHEAGRRAAQGRPRPVPGAGRLRPVRLGPRRQDAGPDRPRQAHRRDLQAAPVQPGPGRGPGGGDVGGPERLHGRRAGGAGPGMPGEAHGLPDRAQGRAARPDRPGEEARRRVDAPS